MVTTQLIPPREECDGELMTMQEFINKMRSFNEMDEDAPWPQDPHDFYYKIDIGNVFRYVYLTKAYELIALEFEAYILDNWNDTRRPCLEIMVARTDELLSNCLYDHKLKKIVFKAMIKSGKTDETIPPPPPANTSESTNNNDEEELDSEDEEEETDSESEDEDDESDSESDEE
tara:strand:- start:3052 stop:3573 length:522 start_codon:yes stop_codon:yes gene_type:complete